MVRVCAVPDLTGMSEEARKEALPVFRYAVGRKFRISCFDDYGCAGIDFVIPVGSNKGWHAVYVETWLLKKLKRA